MHPIHFLSTAFLVVVFVWVCTGAWRTFQKGAQPRPFLERASMAILFGIVGWQALGWLRRDHSFEADVRVIGAWVQLLAAFGIAGVMLAHGWFVARRSNQQ